jgi:ADP-heptose:LPS heptosyltransferase
MNDAHTTARRVLIYRLGSLGDTVVALPCFHLIARTFPDAERRLLTNAPVHEKAPLSAEILGDSGLVHGYMQYPIGLRNIGGLLSLRRQVRAFRPDLLIYLGPVRGIAAARRDAQFFRLCGVREIIGLPLTDDLQKSRWLTEVPGFVRPEAPMPPLPPDIGLPFGALLEPEAWRLARCVASLGDARLTDPASWSLHLTAAEEARARAVLDLEPASDMPTPVEPSPILAAAIGTKVQAKDWGLDKWQALLTQLAALYPEHQIALVGAPSEANASSHAASAWKGRALNLCGKLTPRETAAVLAHAHLFLGLDSGPMHLAAAVGTPIVAIFSARNRPVHWFPFGLEHRIVYHRTDCWGCGLETCVEQKKKCLTSITVEEALAAVRLSLPPAGATHV